MDISIIVPVYNVEKYLVRCLDSLVNQHFSGTFEVIAVDDASTDRSLQILYEYQKNEDRLRVISHETNKKLSITRKTGINAANGDYIMHVDADDWLLPGALRTLFSKCKQLDADVVVFNIMREDEKGNKIYVDKTGKELLTDDKLKVQEYFFGGVVNKITRRTLIQNGISGTVGVNSSEDLLYCFELLIKARTFYMLPTTFYVYYINPESLTRSRQIENYLQDQLILFRQIQLIVSKNKTDSTLTENTLRYLDRLFFKGLALLLFWHKTIRVDKQKIIDSFHDIPIMSKARVKALESAMNNKYICLFQVAKGFGIKIALGIYYRSFKK